MALVPDDLDVEVPEVPYLTELPAGGRFEETFRLAVPVAGHDPYVAPGAGSAQAKRVRLEVGVVTGAGQVAGAAVEAGQELVVAAVIVGEGGGEGGVQGSQGGAVEVGEHDLAGALVVGVEVFAVGGGEAAQEAHGEQLVEREQGVGEQATGLGGGGEVVVREGLTDLQRAAQVHERLGGAGEPEQAGGGALPERRVDRVRLAVGRLAAGERGGVAGGGGVRVGATLRGHAGAGEWLERAG